MQYKSDVQRYKHNPSTMLQEHLAQLLPTVKIGFALISFITGLSFSGKNRTKSGKSYIPSYVLSHLPQPLPTLLLSSPVSVGMNNHTMQIFLASGQSHSKLLLLNFGRCDGEGSPYPHHIIHNVGSTVCTMQYVRHDSR